MGELRRVLVATGAIVICTALVACTAALPEVPAETAEGSSATPSSVAPSPSSSSPPPDTLDPSFPAEEPLLGEIASGRGTGELGPFVVSAGRVALYVRCVGPFPVTVDVVGAASFVQECDVPVDDLGTKNSIDVRYVDEVRVIVSSDNSTLWAVAVTEVTE